MVEAVKEFFVKYAVFQGRTSRKTFWLTMLGLFILAFIIGFIGGIIGGAMGQTSENTSTIISSILSLVTLVPSIAIDTRRLHDINKSGWWQLIAFVPVVGWIILLVFLCLPAVNEGNNY